MNIPHFAQKMKNSLRLPVSKETLHKILYALVIVKINKIRKG